LWLSNNTVANSVLQLCAHDHRSSMAKSSTAQKACYPVLQQKADKALAVLETAARQTDPAEAEACEQWKALHPTAADAQAAQARAGQQAKLAATEAVEAHEG
jgi:hypothetical protein